MAEDDANAPPPLETLRAFLHAARIWEATTRGIRLEDGGHLAWWAQPSIWPVIEDLARDAGLTWLGGAPMRLDHLLAKEAAVRVRGAISGAITRQIHTEGEHPSAQADLHGYLERHKVEPTAAEAEELRAALDQLTATLDLAAMPEPPAMLRAETRGPGRREDDPVRNAKIRKTYKETRSYAATAAKHNLRVDQVKGVIGRARRKGRKGRKGSE